MSGLEMVHLTSVNSEFEAQVLAARLGAQGILWELRGIDSMYPIRPVEVLVEGAKIAMAQEMLHDCAPTDLVDDNGHA